MRNIYLFIVFNLFIFSNLISQTKEITLNSNWFFRNTNESKWYEAKVPGCVHTDLYANKLIPDPFYGNNEKLIQYIETKDYEYKLSFNVEKEFFEKENIILIFEGLDTYADIYLNDKLILKADNMFRKWEMECKNLLKINNNELIVKFQSAVNKDNEKERKSSVKLPDSRAYTRKAPYQYGWDWGPRFVTCGIWKAVKLHAFDNLDVKSVYFAQKKVSTQNAKLETELEINSNSNNNINIQITDIKINKIIATQNSILKKGENLIKIPFSINKPKLWFPKQLGNPYLYEFGVSIIYNGNKIYNTNTSIGLRKIELINTKDSIGESFYFKINDIPLFIKGANYIPANSFPTENNQKTYQKLIENAEKANFNMLRIWGGGIYESDEFYKLCNKHGILVWQDFMFACTMYPGDSSFTENVKQEAIDNVKRIRNHASLALWCGNNEIDEGWHNWGWQKQLDYSTYDSTKVWNDYKKIFHEILPQVVLNSNNATPYISTSPRKGWGRKESMTEGDSHYWGVWWGKEPFEKYIEKTGRFMSEYGFQGMPDLKTITTMVDDSCLNFNSIQLRNHQKHPTGFETINEYLQRDYRKPENFNYYVYVSQLLQAEGMKTAIESHRRSKPKCMGTLYWQFNDCWPVTSWSSIDYNGNWKALHYYVKKLYDDILISQIINNTTIEVWINSDFQTDKQFDLDLQLIDFNGNIKWNKKLNLKIKANSSKIIYQIDKTHLFTSEKDTSSYLLHAKLVDNHKTKYESILYFAKQKNLNLPQPRTKIRILKSTENYTDIDVSSKTLVKNLYFLNNANLEFSDNYFDLIPNVIYTIRVSHQTKPDNILKNITTFSLFDCY